MFIGPSGVNTFSFAGLEPSTEYVIYAYIEDRGSNINGEATILTFVTAGTIPLTSDKARAVETSLKFNQPTLNDAQKNIAMRAVAFKLSLPVSNVIEKKYDVIAK